jgi:hypothetical protein
MSGPEFAIDATHSSDTAKMCLHCGGPVVWMSAREEEELASLHESLRITLWDKITLVVGIAFLLLMAIAVLGSYLGWWKSEGTP